MFQAERGKLNKHRRRRRGGFTFVELLATVTFMGLVLPVAMGTITLCTQLAGRSRQRMEAVSLATVKMTELVASGDWSSGARTGDFADWPAYRWSVDVLNWSESTLVQELEVTITWEAQGRDQDVVLSTLVYEEEQ